MHILGFNSSEEQKLHIRGIALCWYTWPPSKILTVLLAVQTWLPCKSIAVVFLDQLAHYNNTLECSGADPEK